MFKNDWMEHLSREINKDYFINLIQNIKNEYDKYQVYPNFNQIFRALNLTSFEEVKVVILGQDPYYRFGQANGLSFSIDRSETIPKSLHNIFLELVEDLNIVYPKHGDLSSWAKQGVLLLNSVLTVRDGQPKSHRDFGWEKFTDEVISTLNKKKTPIVYMLWGNDAMKKKTLINMDKHIVLVAPHPSPLSAYRGFFGCKHFSQTNRFLRQSGLSSIDWQI